MGHLFYSKRKELLSYKKPHYYTSSWQMHGAHQLYAAKIYALYIVNMLFILSEVISAVLLYSMAFYAPPFIRTKNMPNRLHFISYKEFKWSSTKNELTR
jgi:hypothetical protein